jgi:hypothetical protein
VETHSLVTLGHVHVVYAHGARHRTSSFCARGISGLGGGLDCAPYGLPHESLPLAFCSARRRTNRYFLDRLAHLRVAVFRPRVHFLASFRNLPIKRCVPQRLQSQGPGEQEFLHSNSVFVAVDPPTSGGCSSASSALIPSMHTSGPFRVDSIGIVPSESTSSPLE